MNSLLKSSFFIFGFLLFTSHSFGQDKRGNTIIFGGGGTIGSFTGDTTKPTLRQLYLTPVVPNDYRFFETGSSTISDSLTGKILMLSNGMILYDTLGNIVENGDSLQPEKYYNHFCCPSFSGTTQSSLILPKGSNGLYYVFTPTMTDSAYDLCIGGTTGKCPFDLLQYHIVDMNANGGLGKVIQKNIPLLTHVEMSKVGMMACKHANGYDWWLLKQALDTNLIYTFLVTKDTVLLDTIQSFAEPHFGYTDVVGQSCFSTDGSKYAFSQGSNGKLFLADFDRCYGVVNNPKIFNIPIDSSTHPFYILDSGCTGLCFSPHDSFLYVAQPFHIYQFEYNELDSSLAWYKVKKGFDTTLIQFATYGQLQFGNDGRIYIGKSFGSTGKQSSVISSPNLKGVNCDFCRKCLRNDSGDYDLSSPSNMPNFNMPKKEPCFPIGVKEYANMINELVVYPNPAATIFYIKNLSADKAGSKGKKKELYNAIGELIISTYKNEINVSGFAKGLYFIKCDGMSKKVFIE